MINSIILAGGKGSRMKSDLPKVLHEVCNESMINIIIKNLNECGVNNNIVVIGHESELVKEKIKYDVSYAIQKEQLGTGHAVMMAKKDLENTSGITIIICGDTPLIKKSSIDEMINNHNNNNNDVTIMTTIEKQPTGYGRILRDNNNNIIKIIEEKDASESEKLINEVNAGTYIINNNLLFKSLDKINSNNSQNEYYLTDIIKVLSSNNKKIDSFIMKDSNEILGINDKLSLAKANKIYQRRINETKVLEGAIIKDLDNTYIDEEVIIGKDTIIEPNVTIKGKSSIGCNNHIFNGSYIDNSHIKDNNNIGPYAHLRGGTIISNNCRIGNYVEIKNSYLSNNVAAAHLTYIGDAEIGENVNFGCGAITVNYDGLQKHKTIINDNCFIGSNVNIIAPIHIKDNSKIAAGSTVTEDLEDGTLFIERAIPIIKENYYKK